jgi:streptothricin acetyltransferase
MYMSIERVDRVTVEDIADIDASFDVIYEAMPPFEGPRLQRIEPVAPYYKVYVPEPEPNGAAPDRLVAIARGDDGRLCGYIRASRGDNSLAVVEDVVVDRQNRRSELGRLLMDEARRWTEEQGLAGIRLETQTNNVPACMFYQNYGFTLGGFDRHHYDVRSPRRNETALFWYFFLPGFRRQPE